MGDKLERMVDCVKKDTWNVEFVIDPSLSIMVIQDDIEALPQHYLKWKTGERNKLHEDRELVEMMKAIGEAAKSTAGLAEENAKRIDAVHGEREGGE